MARTTRALRADIPLAAWDALAAQAAAAGIPLGRHARNILTAASGATPSTPAVVLSGPVTDEEWAALKEWAVQHPEVSFVGLSGRTPKMARAIAHGFNVQSFQKP